jgi:hypothetical protein
MNSERTTQLASWVAAALLFTPRAFALDLPLSSEAVREAYFLGQRHDEKTARFFEMYRQHFPVPRSGPYVSAMELSTPYVRAVELSEREFRDRGNSVRLGVEVRYTATYRPATSGSWKDFEVRLSQAGKTLASRSVRYEGIRTGRGGNGPTGFLIWLEYDGRGLAPDDASVEVDTPDGQQVVARFDLSKLR